jgi:hypothetical protein
MTFRMGGLTVNKSQPTTVQVEIKIHKFEPRGLDPLSLRNQTRCDICRLPKKHAVHKQGA